MQTPKSRWFRRVLAKCSMWTAYFDELITCPTFLVQSEDVTFLGKKWFTWFTQVYIPLPPDGSVDSESFFVLIWHVFLQILCYHESIHLMSIYIPGSSMFYVFVILSGFFVVAMEVVHLSLFSVYKRCFHIIIKLPLHRNTFRRCRWCVQKKIWWI